MTVWTDFGRRREWTLGWLTGRRLAVGALLVVLTLVGALWTSGARPLLYGQFGSTNGGVVVTAPYGCLGLELWGSPGFFGGSDPGSCDI
jgi:hypothetical protein